MSFRLLPIVSVCSKHRQKGFSGWFCRFLAKVACGPDLFYRRQLELHWFIVVWGIYIQCTFFWSFSKSKVGLIVNFEISLKSWKSKFWGGWVVTFHLKLKFEVKIFQLKYSEVIFSFGEGRGISERLWIVCFGITWDYYFVLVCSSKCYLVKDRKVINL